MIIKKNYHTHASRCGHANGTDEMYVQMAIEFGITELGFSDHIFLKGYEQNGMRGSYLLLDDYINSLEYLKEKYKNQIKIHIGFEAEALDRYFDYYRELLNGGHIEYLILGNHCEFIGDKLIFYPYREGKEIIDRYVNSLIEGMKTGLFKYVAHPDHFLVGYHHWDDITIEASHRICKAAKELNIPLEINLAHFRNLDWNLDIIDYPYVEFWKIAKEHGCKILVGIDAHSPLDFLLTNYSLLDKLLELTGIEIDQNLDF